MLGIEVIQTFATGVLNIPEIWTVVLEGLDGDRTTVREISAEKIQILSGDHLANFATSTGHALADVFLVFDDREEPLKVLYAPSHVPSPTFDGARLVLLRVRDMGYHVPSPGNLSTLRAVQAHTYVDETV
jgi:hypothetical protein